MQIVKASKYYFVVDKYFKFCLEKFSADLGDDVKTILTNSTMDAYGQYITPEFLCVVDEDGNIVSDRDGNLISVDVFAENGTDLCEYYTKDSRRFVENAILRYFNRYATDLGKRFDNFKKVLNFTGDGGKREETLAKVTQRNEYGKQTVTDKPNAHQHSGTKDDANGWRDGTHGESYFTGTNQTETEKNDDVLTTERDGKNIYEMESITANGLQFLMQNQEGNPVSDFINGFMSIFMYIPE